MLAVMATTAEVAAAMLLLHRAGIVHGDLSASNVLLTR
jgi:tRNA A-37 threonylcarbamoyl transferase component Bud32